MQYEGSWDPDEYDPDSARATLESHIEDAVEAERLGLDGMLLTEHHFDAWTLVPSPNVFLAAVAMRTSRLRLGQAVHVLPIHNPWRLAEETGMLDLISNGRAEVGVGKGNFSVERARYNPPGDDFDQRFEEGLELLHPGDAGIEHDLRRDLHEDPAPRPRCTLGRTTRACGCGVPVCGPSRSSTSPARVTTSTGSSPRTRPRTQALRGRRARCRTCAQRRELHGHRLGDRRADRCRGPATCRPGRWTSPGTP